MRGELGIDRGTKREGRNSQDKFEPSHPLRWDSISERTGKENLSGFNAQGIKQRKSSFGEISVMVRKVKSLK